MKVRWLGLVLEVVRDLREQRAPASPEEVADFETDVLAGFVLARASAGLADATIRGDVGHLEQVRVWFGKSLWDMEAADADIYFGKAAAAWAFAHGAPVLSGQGVLVPGEDEQQGQNTATGPPGWSPGLPWGYEPRPIRLGQRAGDRP